MSGYSPLNYVAVVTAREGSQRLPGKNMFCLSGHPLAVHAIMHGKNAGLEVVVTTDIPLLKTIAAKLGAIVVDRPESLAGADCSHADVIRHAVETSGNTGRNVVLLQPTSPFRYDNVVGKCLEVHACDPSKTVATSRQIHDWQLGGKNNGIRDFVNGCVIIYPAGKIGDYSEVVGVETNPLNYLEIDTEEDYLNACLLSLRYQPLPSPVLPVYLSEIHRHLGAMGIANKPCTLVARADGQTIPQDQPICYVNHCQGYDGGRADMLVLVANEHILLERDERIAECIGKCRIVIIRNHHYVEALFAMYPGLREKSLVLVNSPHQHIDHVTTGAIAQYILGACGCPTTRIGFSSACERASDLASRHFIGASYDNAIFATYGTFREPTPPETKLDTETKS